MIFQGLALREAIASVAMEHPTGCNCRVCKAAAGDLKAFGELWTEATEELERRQAGEARGEHPARAGTRAGCGSESTTETERRSDG
jgi:hypothetical protein